MRTLTRYADFLSRAAASLQAAGAYSLLPQDGTPVPDWLEGWNDLFLLNVPGSAAIYAFTEVDEGGLETLRSRINRLADGLSRSRFSQGPRVGLVAVAVFPHGIEGRLARQVTGLVPSTYYASLAPRTWAVDLARSYVLTPRSLRPPEGRRLIEAAVRNEGRAAAGLDDPGSLQRASMARNQAFYDLMRGTQTIGTYALIAVNVVLFLLLYTQGGPTDNNALISLGAMVPSLVQSGQWWRLFTTMFVHGGIAHIAFNMTSLYVLGTLVERLYGNVKFLAIYLGAGLAGSALSFLHAIHSGGADVPYIGASGAIFGLAGALLAVRFQKSELIPEGVRSRLFSSVLPIVVLNLVWSALTPYVDNYAHIGGLIGGFLLSFIFPLAGRPAGSSSETHVLQ